MFLLSIEEGGRSSGTYLTLPAVDQLRHVAEGGVLGRVLVVLVLKQKCKNEIDIESV